MNKIPFFTMLSVLLALILVAPTSSCSDGNEDLPQSCVDSFATNYFNWRFPAALSYSTTASKKWLAYATSQIRQEDVDSLRAMKEGATIEIVDIIVGEGEATATAIVEVSNYLRLDSISSKPNMSAKGRYSLNMIKENNKWKVSLSELPRALEKK